MALWIADGFDLYAAVSDGTLNYWASSSNMALSNTTRFKIGQSLQTGSSGGNYTKDGFSNAGTAFACFAMLYTGTLSGTNTRQYIQWRDGGTAQLTIIADNGGNIQIRRGGTTGTLIGTYSSAFLSNQWNQFQFEVVFSATVGEVHIRKNGNTSDDFTLTGANTISTANAYANGVQIGNTANDGSWYMDDFAAWDSSGGGNWTSWVGDIRCFTAMPAADTAQKQFTATNGGSTTYGNSTDTTTSTVTNANNIYMFPFAPSCGGSIGTTVNVKLNAGITGNMNVAIYDSDGGVDGSNRALPGTLLAHATAINNPVLGVNAFTLTTSLTLQNRRTYYIGVWADANFTLKATTGTIQRQAFAATYTGTFPSSMTGASLTGVGVAPPVTYATITASNAGMVNDWTEDGATTYVGDGTVSDYDLYSMPSLPTTPNNILGVNIRALVAKSDAGARGYATALKSGATTVATTTYLPNTTFNYTSQFYEQDPDTSANWTATGVNNLQIGPKVAS